MIQRLPSFCGPSLIENELYSSTRRMNEGMSMFHKALLGSAKSDARRCRRGFSMLELMIVIGISLTVAAFAVPYFLTAYHNIQLKSAASDLSGFFQKARIQAARQNAVYSIGYQAVNGAEEAYLDLNVNGQWDANEPLIAFNPAIIPAPGAPNGVGGAPTPYVLVGDTAGVVYDNATTLAYSPRGLPCAYVAGACNTPAAGYFVYYLKDQRTNPIRWGAVVVTRSGRTKPVIWNGVAWQ
jgi:prepilin-type N-terminal cleavage/methylation domain-containing protein